MLYKPEDISNWKLEYLSLQRVGFDTPNPDFPVLLKCLPNLVSLCRRPTSELRTGFLYPWIQWMPEVTLNAILSS